MSLTDSFSGQMDIGNGDTVNIIPSWAMVEAADPIPRCSTSTAPYAHAHRWRTHRFRAGTDINANAGTTVIDNNLTVNSGNLNVAADSTLQLNKTATSPLRPT